ncbi:phage tail sheath family protein, partial [Candidatus Parcubacteria bacterium]
PSDADYQNALPLLDTVKDFSLLAIPGIGSNKILGAGTTYCERRATVVGVNDCFYVGEMECDKDTVQEAQQYIDTLPQKSSYGAVLFPWLEMPDPTGILPTPIKVPPSGAFMGMAGKFPVWEAIAGTKANIGGVSGLTVNLTDAEQDFLNPRGVNVIRSFPGSGIVVWGARTLSTNSQPEWRYIPVRRMAIFLEVSIYNGIQWAVFQPNDEDLWASLRLNISAFMMNLFRQGAFQGATPREAFFVKCDAETTTQADIDAGVVNVLVGFAPLKPAEFVVVKISQKAGQTA